MAITIVATAAGTNSNSYCTIDEANDYIETRLHKSTWTESGTVEKRAALVWATRLLDEKVDWVGLKYSSSQSLRWPRSGVFDQDGLSVDQDTIPTFLKNATAEFALKLLAEDWTEEMSRGLAGFKEIKIDVLEMVLKSVPGKPSMPPSVWSIIRHYGTQYGKRKYLVRV